MVGRSVHLEQTARTPDGYIPLTTDRVDQLTLPDRPHSLSADHVLEHLAVERQVAGARPSPSRAKKAPRGA